MRTRWLLSGGLAISMIALSGCEDAAKYLDPYQKPYAWHPTGAPTANLAAQLVNPHDLAIGRGTTEGDAKEAAVAIDHIWQNKPQPLLVSNGGSGASSGASGGSPGGSN